MQITVLEDQLIEKILVIERKLIQANSEVLQMKDEMHLESTVDNQYAELST